MSAGLRLAGVATGASAASCTALLTLTAHFRTVALQIGADADSATMGIMIAIGEIVLALVTVLVAGLVTHTAFNQAVADFRLGIALRRLIGSAARSERNALAQKCLGAATIGALVGWLAGVGVATLVSGVIVHTDARWSQAALPPVQLHTLLLAAVIWIAASIAALRASRQVASIAPAEAIAAARVDAALQAGGRRVGGAIATALGSALLGIGGIAAAFTPLAVLVAVAGGIVFAIGLVAVQVPLTTAMLRLASALARIHPIVAAALGAMRQSPARSAGIVFSLMVGTTLVQMFAVAGATARGALAGMDVGASDAAYLDELLAQLLTIVTVAVAAASVVAMIGFVSAMLTSVQERTQEIALLRVLGMRRAEARTMILAEAIIAAVFALMPGLILGTALGWLGAYSMLASTRGIGSLAVQFDGPAILLLAAAVLTLGVLAGAPAASRATRLAPMAALRVA